MRSLVQQPMFVLFYLKIEIGNYIQILLYLLYKIMFDLTDYSLVQLLYLLKVIKIVCIRYKLNNGFPNGACLLFYFKGTFRNKIFILKRFKGFYWMFK